MQGWVCGVDNWRLQWSLKAKFVLEQTDPSPGRFSKKKSASHLGIRVRGGKWITDRVTVWNRRYDSGTCNRDLNHHMNPQDPWHIPQRSDTKNVKFSIFCPHLFSKNLSRSAPAYPIFPKSVQISVSGLENGQFSLLQWFFGFWLLLALLESLQTVTGRDRTPRWTTSGRIICAVVIALCDSYFSN